MAFDVRLKASAKKDLLNAIDYYETINPSLSERFYLESVELNELLGANPHFATKYKYIRTYKLRSFPYVVHFVINEDERLVTIIAIAFGKQERSDFAYRNLDT